MFCVKKENLVKKGLIILSTVVFCFTNLCCESVKQDNLKQDLVSYQNPLGVSLADPFIYHEGDVYYLYGTDQQRASSYGFPVLTSTDLVNWQFRGYAFHKTKNTWTQLNYWGPEVLKTPEGKYYMYFNGSPNIKPGPPFNMHLCIAVSDTPLGPFEELKAPFYKAPDPDEAIDQNVFIDKDGTAYLVYTQVTFGRNDIRAARLKDNLVELETDPVIIIRPSEEWESRPWNGHKVTEGAYMFRRGDYYYLLYTANDYQDPFYSIGYATSKNPLGPWEKHKDNPILTKTKSVHGTGNGMLIKSPDGKETFMVYHTHYKPGQVGPRQLAIDRVYFKNNDKGPDVLVVDGPTCSPQPYPSGANKSKTQVLQNNKQK
jgi:beta-xylosidase